MHVVLLEEALTPRRPELCGPLTAVALTRETRHLMDFPVEDRQLVRGGALIAVAAEAVAQRELHHIAVRRPDETGGRDALARELLERFQRPAQVRSHERPAQTPALLRVDVGGHRDLALDADRLRARIALVR